MKELTRGMLMVIIGLSGIGVTLIIAMISALVSKRKHRVLDDVSMENSSEKKIQRSDDKTEVMEENETEYLDQGTEILDEN